jgi:hypothetical protein
MNKTDQIVAEFEKLIQEGRSILSTSGWDGSDWEWRFPRVDDFFRIRTRGTNLVHKVCGQNSAHYREIASLPKESIQLPGIVGILEAAKADFEGGFLLNLRALAEAEILGDFLDQAGGLLEANHHIPAASLTGAVLEDTLRKISDAAQIQYSASTKIDSLNVELAKAGIYDNLIQKQITAWADIRNNADHGHFDKVKRADVEDMIKWVQRFASEYLK